MGQDALAPAIEALGLTVAAMANPLVLGATLAMRILLAGRLALAAAGTAIAGAHAVPELISGAAPDLWAVIVACNLLAVALLAVGFGWCIAAWLALRRTVGTLLGRPG